MIIVINKTSKDFPGLLAQIEDCPKKLYCLGNANLLKERKIIAIVGSRQMSEYGKRVINKIVRELVKEGYVIVSGMAFGVDAEVQRVCLENKGKTIAVLAGGVDVISPLGNKWLYEKILGNEGLIVSEWPDKTQPNKLNFLKRNRIVSGLSLGVLVIEGSVKSGTRVTARLAAEQGREVFCISGRIDDDNSFAPNYLIKNGATSVTETSDIIENL
jgi:DNA processing protein